MTQGEVAGLIAEIRGRHLRVHGTRGWRCLVDREAWPCAAIRGADVLEDWPMGPPRKGLRGLLYDLGRMMF